MKNNYNSCVRKLVLLSATSLFLHIAPGHAATPVLTCSQLNSFAIPAHLIGIPTNGANVTSTQMILANGSGARALGDYCKVFGDIKPIDPAAPNITFEIHLPFVWNQKAMMFGGGGFDGELNIFVNLIHAAPSDKLTAQGRGYAVFGSNGGHVQQPPFIFGRDGSFAMNDEALRNYAYEALKKTRDASMQVIGAYYGLLPNKTYFHGGSTGGREAIIAMQKWPQDFDGIMAFYPALDVHARFMQVGRISKALSQPGAYLNFAKRKFLHDATIAACDHLDGIVDGLISNVTQCNQLFSTRNSGTTGILAGLRCPGGADTADNCLSDVQIAMLNTMNTSIKLPFKLSNGTEKYPGYNIWSGADLGYPDDNVFLLSIFGLNSAPPSYPVWIDQPIYTIVFDQWMKYFVTRDVNFNSVGLSLQELLPYERRINYLALVNNDNVFNLSAFRNKGGKLIMLHGMADTIVSTRKTEQYYSRLVDTMGPAKVNDFVRFYEVPGYGHSVSADFNAGWDSISALENWVENGIAPVNQVVEDKNKLPNIRTRPLCEYPAWPRYNGQGDINMASSFHCVSDHEQFEDDEDDGRDGD